MSRVMFLSMDEQAALEVCRKQQVGVSAIEALPEGGVRLVCMSSDGAASIRAKLGSKVMRGEPLRARHRPARPLW